VVSPRARFLRDHGHRARPLEGGITGRRDSGRQVEAG
jgi:hypothetical protein